MRGLTEFQFKVAHFHFKTLADKTTKLIIEILSRGGAKVAADVQKILSDTERSAAKTDRAIEQSNKTRLAEQTKNQKRAADEFLRELSRVESAEKKVAGGFTVLGGSIASLFGNIGSSIVSSLTNSFTQLPSIISGYIDEAINIATERTNALKGLESVAAFKGIDANEAQKSVQSLRLVKAGIIELGDASTALKNLLSSGFNLKQSIELLERFSDSAAFGKQSALSFGEALTRTTEGIKAGNSALADGAGMTKNLSAILKERGFELEDLTDKTKQAAANEALYKGIIEETAAQVGDADKLMQGWTGTVSSLTTAKKNLLAEIGNIITTSPELIALIKLTTSSLNAQTASYQKAGSESKKATSSMVSDFSKLALEGYIAAMRIKAGFVEAGQFVAIGLSGIALTFRLSMLSMAKSINVLLIDPINTAIAGIAALNNASAALRSALGINIEFGNISPIQRVDETGLQNSLEAEVSRLKLLWQDVDKSMQNANTSATNLRKIFQDLTNETKKQLDYENQSDKLGATATTTDAVAETEKDGKKREAAIKKQLSDLLNVNREYLESQRIAFEAANRATEKQFADGVGTFEDYKRLMLASIDNFKAEVLKTMGAGFSLAKVGKSGTELEAISQSYKNQVAKFDEEISKQRGEIAKKSLENEKKVSEDKIKLAERYAERDLAVMKNRTEQSLIELDKLHAAGTIKEALYQKSLAAIKLIDLKREKEINEELLKTYDKGSEKYQKTLEKIVELDTKVKGQIVANTKAVTQAIKEATTAQDEFLQGLENRERNKGEKGENPDNAPGGAQSGVFDSITSSMAAYLQQAVLVQDTNGGLSFSFAQMFDTIKNIGFDAFASLTEGFGQMVSNWVLYGNTGGLTLRKLAAQVLSNLAGIATQYALMCLAAAAFATTVFGAAILGGTPAQFLLAAAAFGALAIGAAVAGRIVAGDSFNDNKAQNSFNNQTSQATGGNRATNGGSVYSSYGDDPSIVNIGRNAPQTINGEVTLRIKEKPNWFEDMFETMIEKNGKGRRLLIDTAAG